jgi:isoprenylcysteine carboxyl methyltransferase (ICMT) family protein YpbQ
MLYTINLMDYRGLLISIVIATCIVTLHVSMQKRKESPDKGNVEEDKQSPTNTIIIFGVSFSIIYMVYVLINDCNDHAVVYNNIKIGEPPF